MLNNSYNSTVQVERDETVQKLILYSQIQSLKSDCSVRDEGIYVRIVM